MQEDKDMEEKWKQAREDMIERSKKRGRLSLLPLEEAMAHANFPVYGLTQEVCGLRQGLHWYPSENAMVLEYHSPRYKQHEKCKGRTFLVESRLYEKNVIPDNSSGMPPTQVFAGWILDDISEQQGHHRNFVAKGAVFTIDGKRFEGLVAYYSVPLCYSRFTLSSGHIGLSGEALGPSIDDLIQILESLHLLNGKEVE
jgi:hypothetical protein